MPDNRLKLLTVGRIAELLKVRVSRISYLIRNRPEIQPVAWAGNARLFNHDDLARIRHELNAIDARQAAREESRQGVASASTSGVIYTGTADGTEQPVE